jgi:hypothetical protein
MIVKPKTWTEGWLPITGVLLLLGAGVLLSLHEVDRQRQSLARSAELSFLPKGEYLKVAVLGYRHIVADLLWLKAVQGLSGRKQTREGYLGAYHAADVLTDLDPGFVHAYQYPGTVFGVIAGMPHESIALLTKGVQHNPSVWQLSFFLGYDYYYELQDPVSAAKHFQSASLLPGAPPWLAGLAARMAVEANNPNAALEFLQRIYLQAEDEEVKEGLAKRIREVAAERDLRALEKAIKSHHERMGKFPETLDDLVKSGILPGIPPEPFGGHYEYSPADGSVKSSGLQERLRVYRH